jgi:hypothetical protein
VAEWYRADVPLERLPTELDLQSFRGGYHPDSLKIILLF